MIQTRYIFISREGTKGKLFVDKTVRNRLLRVPGVSRRDSMWRTVKVSPGHDSHVHLRLEATSRFRNKSLDEIRAMVAKHFR